MEGRCGRDGEIGEIGMRDVKSAKKTQQKINLYKKIFPLLLQRLPRVAHLHIGC